MTTVTASMVKELRDKTGAGMMDCKTALTETDGDMEEAVDWLRKKGLSKAAKKAGRIAAEGLIGVAVEGQGAAPWSRSTPRPTSSPATSSSRTWCARSPRWRRRPRATSHKLLAMPYPGKSLHGRRARQGDGRHHRREHERAPHGRASSVGDGVVAEYVHNKVADGLGKIGVLVALESKGDKAALADIRPPARHAHRRGEPGGRDAPTSSTRR